MMKLDSQEIKEIIESAPYNYCDYRCEVCSYQTTCRVYKDEQKQKMEAIRQGLDPWSPEVVANNLHENFQKAMHYLEKGAKKFGIKLEDLKMSEDDEKEWEERQKKAENHPLVTKSKQFFYDAHDYLKKFYDNFVCHLDLKEPYFYLGYYPQMVAAKIYRSISGWYEDKNDEEAIHFIDAFLSAKVALNSAMYSKEALAYILQNQKDFQEDLEKLLKVATELVLEISQYIKKELGTY